MIYQTEIDDTKIQRQWKNIHVLTEINYELNESKMLLFHMLYDIYV